MTRYVALLRGINVGRGKLIAMADLREVLTGLGFTAVKTHLRSGNALVTTPSDDRREVADRIEKGVTDRLGVSARCLVRTAGELTAVVDANPFTIGAGDGSKLLVQFLDGEPDARTVADHDPVSLAPAEIRLGPGVIYQWCPDGILAAPDVSAFVRRHWPVEVTGRNWNTVTKLHTMMKSDS